MRRVTAVLLALALPVAIPAAAATAAGVRAPARGIAVTAPTTVLAGGALTVSGRVTPARPGRMVQLWVQRGKGWEPVAETTESATGAFVLRTPADSVGRHSYRAVTEGGVEPRREPQVRGPVRVVTTLPARQGTAQAYLGLTDPVGGVVDDYGDYYRPGRAGSSTSGPSTHHEGVMLAGRVYPRSLRTTSRALTWSLGADARTFSATLGLVAVRRGATLFTGTRVVEVEVDGITRARRTLEAADVVPVVIDVRGHRYVTVRAQADGWLPQPVAADVVVGTPVVSNRVRAERGVVTGQLLSNLYAEVSDLAAGTSTSPAAPADLGGEPLLDGWVVPTTVGTSSLRAPRSRYGLFGGSLVAVAMSDDPPPGVVAQIELPLRGGWTRLTGRPAYGPAGAPRPDLSARIELYGDGRLLSSLPVVRPGVAGPRTVDVTGVQVLRVVFVSDHPIGADLLALADPRLT